jgi:hypothetical protein
VNGKFSNLTSSGDKIAHGIQVRKFVHRFRVMKTSKILAVRETQLRWWFRAFKIGVYASEDLRECGGKAMNELSQGHVVKSPGSRRCELMTGL